MTERHEDITLGEVNRNVGRVEQSFKEGIREIKEGFVTKDQFQNIVDRVTDIENSARSKTTTWIALAGIIVPSAVAIWAVVHG